MRSRTAASVALVLLALAIVICWWLAANGEAAPMRGQEQAREPAVLGTSASSIDRREVPTREPVAAGDHAREGGDDPPSPFDLRGTFVVVDHNGVEHAAESGVVDIDGFGTGFDVRSGAWRKPESTSRDRLRVVKAMLGGKPVVCDIDVALEPSNPPLQLRGRWLAPVRLRVVGSDSGADLANVRVAELEYVDRIYGRQHPAANYTIDASTVVGSPVLLWPEPGK